MRQEATNGDGGIEAGRAQIVRRVLLALLVVALFLIVAYALDLQDYLSQKAIMALIAPLGMWGPVGFLALFVLVVLFSLPSTAMVIAGGALFGLWGGLVVNAVGLNAGALLSFLIARKLGHGLADRWMNGRLERLRHELEHRGLSTVLLVRVSGVFPLAVVNYGAGLARVSWVDYAAGTFLGLLPGMAVYTFLGASIATFKPWQIATALGVLAVMAIATLLWRHRKGVD